MSGKRKIIFHTKRLSITAFLDKDIVLFMEYHNDADWMKYQGFKGLSRDKYCNVLLKEADFQEGAQLAVLLNDVLIGELFVKIEDNAAEIGYSLKRDYSGNGY